MSHGEHRFLQTWIRTRKIPTLALTVKDHKPPNADGNYPMRTIVSAHNFTQGFAKLASQGLQAIFERNSIQHGKRTILNSYDLKSRIERLQSEGKIDATNITIISFDIKDMYPMSKYEDVVKAVRHYSRVLDDYDRASVEQLLDMLKFSMGNTICQFGGNYYEYCGDEEPDRRGLSIGGFESAFLADLLASYLLDMTSIIQHHDHSLASTAMTALRYF